MMFRAMFVMLFIWFFLVVGVPFLFIAGFAGLANLMNHERQEHRKELRKEEYSIEGEILKTETVTEMKPVKEEGGFHFSYNADKDKKEEKSEEKEPILKPVKTFVISFVDGREKSFDNVSDKPLEIGKYYIIKYNGLGEITEAQVKE